MTKIEIFKTLAIEPENGFFAGDLPPVFCHFYGDCNYTKHGRDVQCKSNFFIKNLLDAGFWMLDARFSMNERRTVFF